MTKRISLKERVPSSQTVESAEVDDNALDMYFIAVYVCVGGVAYFLLTLLKSFITQGVV